LSRIVAKIDSAPKLVVNILPKSSRKKIVVRRIFSRKWRKNWL